MAELAVVSIRKSKMQKYLEEGNKNAQIVFDLLEDPNEFLSTVQIGISLIGVLTGAFGGVTLAEPLSQLISFIPYNEPISVAIVVIVTTYLTLVIGEIVPKVIALNDPERVSLKVAKSMVILSKISKPVSFIFFLFLSSFMTSFPLKWFSNKSCTNMRVGSSTFFFRYVLLRCTT